MQSSQQQRRDCLRKRSLVWWLAAGAICGALQGCAALSNPVVNGVPVRKVPPELLGESKEGSQTIPMPVLRQKRPEAYLIGPEDVLGVWIEGILGEKGQAPPMRLPESGNLPPALGFPIPVRDDGTIALPFVDPVKVQGMTLEQVDQAVRKAYTVTKKIIQPGRERIMITLQRPRQYHVLVIRQDAGASEGTGGGGGGGTGLRTSARATGFIIGAGGGGQGARRGTGYAIDLPAYENDVLNALAHTGGLPGTDAVDEVIIERGAFKGGREEVLNMFNAGSANLDPMSLVAPGTQRIRIPLRLRPGEQLSIRPEDVILQNGDIVFIQAREADVFYTAGLLPACEYVLPRDTDLDVVEAITRIAGSIDSGGISTFNINGTLILPGFGFPSPSLVSIVRKTPGHGQMVIQVDLNLALRDGRERILIQPRDLLILQATPEEAVARYVSEIVKFSIVEKFINTSRTMLTGTAAGTGIPTP